MEQQTCVSCQFPVLSSFNFCPNCGKKFKEPPIKLTITKKIGIYALSLLLPPLGLWPAIRYLRQPDRNTKVVGIIAIILTIISIAASVWLSINLISTISKNLNTQLNQIQNLQNIQNTNLQ